MLCVYAIYIACVCRLRVCLYVCVCVCVGVCVYAFEKNRDSKRVHARNRRKETTKKTTEFNREAFVCRRAVFLDRLCLFIEACSSTSEKKLEDFQDLKKKE